MNGAEIEDHFIDQQIAYYRARAAEFGSSHHTPSAELRAGLTQFAPHGQVVELACGTGIWSAEILRHPVTALTCIDASPEMLAIHSANVTDPRVRRERQNLFNWQAAQRYDAVVFAFWLSHVPPTRFAEFWDSVGSALKPDGRVFFIDDDHRAAVTEQRLDDAEIPAVVRTLADGTKHVAIKLFHQPETLAHDLAQIGWRADVRSVGSRFLSGTASPRQVLPV